MYNNLKNRPLEEIIRSATDNQKQMLVDALGTNISLNGYKHKRITSGWTKRENHNHPNTRYRAQEYAAWSEALRATFPLQIRLAWMIEGIKHQTDEKIYRLQEKTERTILEVDISL